MGLARRSRVLVLTTTLISLACGGGGGTQPPALTLAQAPTSGDNQIGNAGQQLATPLAVIVTDGSGSPKSGVSITWAPTVGGGTVSPGTSPTDASGIATTTLTLGADSVTQKVTATAQNASGSPVTFNATARISGATQIAFAPAPSGNAQTDTVLATLPSPYRVTLKNETGAPVQGVSVAWAVPAGQGSVSSSSTSSDVNGIDSVTRKLGSTAGTQTATATVKGLIGSPVTFTATALSGLPTVIAKNGGGGDGQTGAVNAALPTAHSVIVHDGHGNVVPGVPVAWVVGDGGGSVNPTNPSTASNGVASTVRTLGSTVGTQTDTAKVPGLTGSPVVFTATGALPVQVGDIFFKSVHNGSQNPAVDTIPAGGTVLWQWVGSLAHSVQSTGSPSFASSSIMAGVGHTYVVTFTTPGTYAYDCVVHGTQMTGRVIVQ